MCNSSAEGKDWTKRYVQRFLQKTSYPHYRVLDVGAGRGTYEQLLRQTMPPSTTWVAVEAWGPYIENFKLKDKYDIVLQRDVRSIDLFPHDHYDIAFCGDVLEHMTKEEAVALVDKLRSMCGAIIISIPIIHWPQHDEVNPFQIHVKDDWTHEEMVETFPEISACYVGQQIGVYAILHETYLYMG